ncbi:MAG: hypothetical protein DMD92_21660 [Candidatus Rokuibacteriota bacterium]|nr:MAG: hypothetical protein DMD92_21660 [Candidatus Rokubacteria bacterium]
MYYERHGRVDGDAPPVLLLHGLGSSATDWPEQLAGFGSRCRLLLVDLPGHHRSAFPAGRLTVERMAALSLGACVGLALAFQAPARSDRSHWSTASPASGPRAREAFGGWWRAWRSPPRRR